MRKLLKIAAVFALVAALCVSLAGCGVEVVDYSSDPIVGTWSRIEGSGDDTWEERMWIEPNGTVNSRTYFASGTEYDGTELELFTENGEYEFRTISFTSISVSRYASGSINEEGKLEFSVVSSGEKYTYTKISDSYTK